MSPERQGTILGVIVAAAVLAAAFIYVPIGTKLTARPAAPPVAAPAPAPAAPAPRGPVVREVPDQ